MEKKKVFISYKHCDFETVTKICTVLDDLDVSYWIDSNDIAGGAFAGKIMEGIRNSSLFIVCLSKTSCVSPNVLNEVNYAFRRFEDDSNFVILPIYLEKIDSIEDTDMYYYLGRQSALYMYEPSFEELLKKRIAKTLNIDLSLKEPGLVTTPSKNLYYSYDNSNEERRLSIQQNLILNYDMEVYRKMTKGKTNLTLLDVGSAVGKSIRTRVHELNKDRNVISKVVGLEYDSKSVDIANKIKDNCKFYNIDIESASFSNDLKEICREENIEKFDIINLSLIILHLENPLKVLRVLKRFLKPDGMFFIRDVDDGFTYGYPDEEGIVDRFVSIVNDCETSGFRKSGRRVTWYLKDIGMKHISVEHQGMNSTNMSEEELDAFFDMSFSWIPEDVKIMCDRYPTSKTWKANYEFITNNMDNVLDYFHTNGFVYVLGTLIIVASNEEIK